MEERSVETSLEPAIEIKVPEEVVQGRERRRSFSQILRLIQSGNSAGSTDKQKEMKDKLVIMFNSLT